jgi:hypothetical protein
VRSNFGLELAIGNNPLANGKTYVTSWSDPNSPMDQSHPYTSSTELARVESIGELAYMREKQRVAMRWIADHPIQMLRLTLARFRLFWLPSADLWAAQTSVVKLKAGLMDFISIAALLDLIWLVNSKNKRAWLFGAALIGPSLIYMVTHVDPRYRYPTFALSTLLAVDFLIRLWQYFKRRNLSDQLNVLSRS